MRDIPEVHKRDLVLPEEAMQPAHVIQVRVRLDVPEHRLVRKVDLEVLGRVDQERLVVPLPRPRRPGDHPALVPEVPHRHPSALSQGYDVVVGKGLRVVDIDHHHPPGGEFDDRAVAVPDVQEVDLQGHGTPLKMIVLVGGYEHYSGGPTTPGRRIRFTFSSLSRPRRGRLGTRPSQKPPSISPSWLRWKDQPAQHSEAP